MCSRSEDIEMGFKEKRLSGGMPKKSLKVLLFRGILSAKEGPIELKNLLNPSATSDWLELR